MKDTFSVEYILEDMFAKDQIMFILNTLSQNGFKAYLVGGCVRDMIMGYEPKDFDFCTNAKPEEIKNVFSDYTTILTGEKHGTITVVIKGIPFEITTFRVDGEYTDGRRPDTVSFVDDLILDLSRRDFTMNAIAWSLETGIFDYFHGRRSISNGVIECVGNAEQRIKEDPLRIMRAIRFASKYGFKLDEHLQNTIINYYELLDMVSKERIRDELCKLIMGDCAKTVLNDFSFVLDRFIPGIIECEDCEQNTPYHLYNVWEHTSLAVSLCQRTLVCRLALLFHDLGKPDCKTTDENGVDHFYKHGIASADKARVIMKDLRFSNNVIDEVVELVYYHDSRIEPTKTSVKRWLNKIGETTLENLLVIRVADIMAQSEHDRKVRLDKIELLKDLIEEVIYDQTCFSIRHLAITGGDLIAAGYKQGKIIGEILDHVLELVILNELKNNKEEILVYVSKVYKT